MSKKRLTSYNKLLHKYWGYDSLKPEQYSVICNILDGKDVCAILATGFGKSICYQLPTLISKKCVIVISPLIALMHEQGEEMKRRNIPVCVFNSTKDQKEKDQTIYNLTKGEYMLIYMTPEFMIRSQEFIQKLVDINNLALICIDEAHAVSTWGLDFRPSYTKLNVIREWIPTIPILTLTATASTKVKADVVNILNLNDPLEITGSFDRPNLTIKVFSRTDDVITDIGDILTKYKNEYIIIYCKTRDETDKLAKVINSYKINCEAYHAGVSDIKRNEIQTNFINGKTKCMVATIAFGMGINIPNVRLVIHYNCPKNVESYYQEIGRAGRDGLPSECYLYYSKKDFYVNRLFLKTITDDAHRMYQESQIRLIEKYVYSTECRRKLLLTSFGQNVESCVNCDNCLNKLIQNKNEIINTEEDYTLALYLFFNLISKIDNKFGAGMLINILLGNKKKIKEYMCNFDEFGAGDIFGVEKWWKEFVRILINNDYLIETQIKGSFGATLSLTSNGKKKRNELITEYPKYTNLFQAKEECENSIINSYPIYKIMFPLIKVIEKKKTVKITKPKIITTTATKIINEKNTFVKNMPTTFFKFNVDDLSDDLEKDLALLD
jgi:Werner syndrome ATP-dependent helicase